MRGVVKLDYPSKTRRRHEAALLGSRTMPGFASRLALGVAVCGGLAAAMRGADGTSGATDWPSTNYDQTANRYSPLDQITASNVAHASAGLELSSQARRLYRPPAGRRSHSPRDRQHDVSRRRRTAPSTRWTPRPARRNGSSSFPTTTCRRSAASPIGRAAAVVPPSIIFGATRGRALLDQGVGRHAQCRVWRERRRQSQDARGDADRA